MRPTFDAGHVSIETYLMDFEGDIYGERMTLDILHRIRGERAFPKWSMGHIDGATVDDTTHKKLVRQALVEYRLPEQARLLQMLVKQLSKAA